MCMEKKKKRGKNWIFPLRLQMKSEFCTCTLTLQLKRIHKKKLSFTVISSRKKKNKISFFFCLCLWHLLFKIQWIKYCTFMFWSFTFFFFSLNTIIGSVHIHVCGRGNILQTQRHGHGTARYVQEWQSWLFVEVCMHACTLATLGFLFF